MKKTPFAFCLLLLLAVACQAADGKADAPLPPWYPPLKEIPPYSPERFIPRSEATIKLPCGIAKEAEFTEVISLAGEWKFSGLERSVTPFPKDSDLAKGFEKTSFDDANWSAIAVPKNFYLDYNPDPGKPYAKAWYRKRVKIPASASGQRTVLHFGVIGYEATLFVNGREIASHHGDFTPWTVEIGNMAEAEGEALIAIRVFSDLGPNKNCKAYETIQLATHAYGSQYEPNNIKGGLWRNAEMRIEPSSGFVKTLITPRLDTSSIDVSCRIVNASGKPCRRELFGSVASADSLSQELPPAPPAKILDLTLQPGTNEISFSIPLKAPKLWSPDSPALYNLVLALAENGKATAAKGERFGLRSFKTDGGDFLLNGKRIYLFGESVEITAFLENGRPELDQPDLNASARAHCANFLRALKAGGANTLRLSEQPVPEVFLDLADECGMMIYDMWAWSYNGKLAPSFEKTNLEELGEWLERDYNHPSVIMWIGGNEVVCDRPLADAFERQSRFIRSFDKSGRPVSVFSGAASSVYSKELKLDSDLLDLHSYIGLFCPWSQWEGDFGKQYAKNLAVYSKDGKSLGMPYVIWELVGFSWGGRYSKYEDGDVATYLKWARSPSSWGHPNGVGWSGSIGLAAALDRNRGALHGMTSIGRRIMELVRQDTRVSGFAPWFTRASPKIAARTLWNQPVFCGLRGESSCVPPRNLFAGEAFKFEPFVVNSTNETFEGATMEFVLHESDGSERTLLRWNCGALMPWTKSTSSLSASIPAADGARWAQLRTNVLARDGKPLSRNFYDVFIQGKNEATAPLKTSKRVGILSCETSGEAVLRKILDTLKIKYSIVSKAEELAGLDALIVPPSDSSPSFLNPRSPRFTALLGWVRNGGTLLILERSWNGELGPIVRTTKAKPTLLSDLAVPAHPAFKGLSKANFEFWNGDPLGLTAKYVLSPIGQEIVAARGSYCGESECFMVLSDGKLEKGRVTLSQFDACSKWMSDSAATVYLRNLLASAVGPVPPSLPPCDEREDDFILAKGCDTVFIDIAGKANMEFRDEVAGDGKGGWTDQGENDFRMMPLGLQSFRGVPFKIIDPADNAGKSCVVLKSSPAGDFKDSVMGLRVAAKLSRIFFLHSEAFAASGKTIEYEILYEDGTSARIANEENISIADWWKTCGDLAKAKLALVRKNACDGEIGLMIMEWENPHPGKRIESIGMRVPKGKDTISMLVAITGERASEKQIAMSGRNWIGLADAGKGKVLKTGPFIPEVSPLPSDSTDAICVKMPNRSADDPKPVILSRFMKNEEVRALKDPLRYLVFDLKGLTGGEIELTLPDNSFARNFKTRLSLCKDDEYHSVRVPLDGMPFEPGDLRGEIYIFNSGSGACSFQLRNLRLE